MKKNNAASQPLLAFAFLASTLSFLFLASACSPRPAGIIEFQHATSYDTPQIHRPVDASSPVTWENPRILSPLKVEFPAWVQSEAPVGFIMRLYVNEDGETENVEIISRDAAAITSEVGDRLTNFTTEAVRHLKFERLVRDSVALKYTTVVTIVYRPVE